MKKKNSEIHEGLEQKEVRDFLTISLIKNYEDETNLKMDECVLEFNSDSFIYAIKTCENLIKFHTKKKRILEQRYSIINLIKNQGWLEFDVSDETILDIEHKYWMIFIGTEEEYNNFLETKK